MRFEPTADQRDFAAALDGLVSGADPVAVNRAWASGDTAPGLALWRKVADLGVAGLLVAEDEGGLGAGPVELVVAAEVLGRHAVPGPWIESAAFLATALAPGDDLDAVVAGELATVAAPPAAPLALDADAASHRFVATPDGLHRADVGEGLPSLDPSRRVFRASASTAVEHRRLDDAFDLAALATSAALLGAGERILAESVTYVGQRTQFGRRIGSYQAIKHQLANVRVALDFARPLVHGAAVDPGPRAVSAAKIQAGRAADLAARVGLQVHGAIGYTEEHDLSRWLLRAQALRTAWGTHAFHRDRLLAGLLAERSSA